MKYFKGTLAWLLTVCMILSMFAVNGIVAKADGTAHIEFQDATKVDGNAVQYTVDGKVWTVSISDLGSSSWRSGGSNPEIENIPDGTGLTFTLSGGDEQSPKPKMDFGGDLKVFSGDNIITKAFSASSSVVQIRLVSGQDSGQGDGGETNPPAAEAGEISFGIEGSGKVSYSTDNKATWITVSNNSKLTSSDLTDGDTVYIKAKPDDGNRLDPGSDQQRNRFDNNDNFIPWSDLENGDYSFEYNSSKSYEIKIKFEPNGGGGGGTQVAPGKYKVSFQIDSDIASFFTPSVTIYFLDESDDVIWTETISAGKGDTDIPSGATKIKVTTSKDKLANARLRTSTDEYELLDDIRNEEKGYSLQPIEDGKGYEVYMEFSNKMNVSWSYDSNTAAPD